VIRQNKEVFRYSKPLPINSYDSKDLFLKNLKDIPPAYKYYHNYNKNNIKNTLLYSFLINM